MALYKKLPDTIEAIQYTGYNFEEILEWVTTNQEEEERHVSASQCGMVIIINFHNYDIELHQGDYLYKTDDPNDMYWFGKFYNKYFNKHYVLVEEEVTEE